LVVALFGKSLLESPPPVDAERKRALLAFQRRLEVRFRNLSLLNLALSHRSFANETGDVDNNERLEFLGDAVLGLTVSQYLYEQLSGRAEGVLARVKSIVVSEQSLVALARKLRLDDVVLIGKGEEASGGRSKKAILADAMEAVIGACYLDSGLAAAGKLVSRHLVPEVQKVLEDRHRRDYKTLLQELAQRKFKTYPRYRVTETKGPDHDQTFWTEVTVDRRVFGPGKGKSKKEAEQEAAEFAFLSLESSAQQ